jgi:hypothetical protein
MPYRAAKTEHYQSLYADKEKLHTPLQESVLRRFTAGQRAEFGTSVSAIFLSMLNADETPA